MEQSTMRSSAIVLLALAWNLFPVLTALSQAPPPSEQMQTMSFESPVAPQFKYARNMAILDRFGVNTFSNQFEYFTYNANHYLIVKEFHATGDSLLPDTTAFRFYNVTDPSQPVRLGRINLPDSIGAGDIESFQYGDTTRLIFYGVRARSDTAGNDLYLDVLVNPAIMSRIQSGETIDTSGYGGAYISKHSILTAKKYNEMIFGHDHHLLLATNLNILRIVDLSTPSTFDLLSDIEMYPTPSCTQHTEVKNHEVKAFTRSNGDILVGVGVLRSGMKILTFDPAWNLTETVEQNYDQDRTLFPETIINPTKVMWDSTIYQPLADSRNNKWDHRVCHSVLPYDDEMGGHFVLTVDEFTSSNSGQYENGQWIPALWEGLDFYAPNRYDTTSERTYPI